MRKSTVLAVVIVVVVILVLFLSRMLASKSSDGAAQEGREPAGAEESTPHSESAVDLGAAVPAERSALGDLRERGTAPSATGTVALRVKVIYASGLEDEPAGLDVGLSNLTGSLFKLQHVAPNVFELADGVPGSYVVAAKASGFRTAVVRTRLSAKSPAAHLTITLVSERKVRVRWRSDDGRSIRASVADAKQFSDSVLLEVCATKFSAFEARPLDRHALDWLRSEIEFYESETGGQIAREKRVEWTRSELIDEPPPSDNFGTLYISEDGAFFANAFCRGVYVASLLVNPGQTEVEFVTSLADLERRGATVKMIVVDDATGQPIEDASLKIDAFEDASVSKEGGSLLAEFVPPGRRVGVMRAFGYVDTILNFMTRVDETTDLGVIRMSVIAPEAHFRVVDEAGASVVGVQLELAELGSGEMSPLPILSTYIATSSGSIRGATGANIHFSGLQRSRHVLRCNRQSIDVSPRIVEATELSSLSSPRLIAVIVVQPANTASFVLDPPIAKWTQVMIETSSGLPLRELDVDEFGIATTAILPGSYKLHLIEYGRATGAVDMHVDTNPFVFDIQR